MRCGDVHKTLELGQVEAPFPRKNNKIQFTETQSTVLDKAGGSHQEDIEEINPVTTQERHRRSNSERSTSRERRRYHEDDRDRKAGHGKGRY